MPGIFKLFTFALLSTFLCVSNAREVLILANPQTPHKYVENNQLKGIDIEVIDLLMRRLSLKFKVVFIESDKRILREAENGDADMLLLFSKKPSREKFLIYPKESYIDITWNFFVHRDNVDKIHFNSLDDLRGYLIGATDTIAYTPEFWESGLELDIVYKNSLQLNKLVHKRIDAVPLNTISALYEAKSQGHLEQIAVLPQPLKSKPYYNVFVKKSDHPDLINLVRRYDEIIRDMKEEGTIERIINKYTGNQSVASGITNKKPGSKAGAY